MSHSDLILKGIRTRLLISYPFFGSALSDLKLLPARDVRRFRSNGLSMLYNEEFVEDSSAAELAYWLCREILQLTMDFDERKRRRSRVLWAMSVEYAINSILTGEGLTRGIPIKYYRRDFLDKSAEEIYAILTRETVNLGVLGHIEELDCWLSTGEDGTEMPEREQDFYNIARELKADAHFLVEIINESQIRRRERGYV